MTRVLIIGAGRLQVAAYEAARRLGIASVGVDRDASAPGLALADVPRIIDTRDAEAIVASALAEHVDAVVTLCTDLPVRSVAAVADRLGLHGISLEAAELATDKARMREAFRRARLPSPAWSIVQTAGDAAAWWRSRGAAAVVKPRCSSGSRGVSIVRQEADLARALDQASAFSDEQGMLIEDYVDGAEISVETLSFRGQHVVVAITDKTTSGEPHFVEIGHVQPSRLPMETQVAASKLAAAALTALGVDNAAGHIEMRIGSAGPVLIELGARLGGDFIGTELVQLSTGIDLAEGIIQVGLGRTPDLRHRHRRGAAIRYLAAAPGRVVRIHGAEEARAMPHVVRLEIDVNEGSRVPEVRSSLQRPGFVLCEAEGAQGAEAAAVAAARRVSIVTLDDAATS